MTFITDLARKSALNAVHSHVRRKDSVLIDGSYGAGKTELLKQIQLVTAVRVLPLGGVYQILGRMCKIYDASPRAKDRYLDMLMNHPRPIIIDEAQHLPEGIFPYLKIIIDNGNSLIMAGRSELHDRLRTKYPDVLSRLTVVRLNILSYEDMLTLVPDFDPEDFGIIYHSMDNMRAMMTCVKNCRDYAQEHEIKTITHTVIEQFINVGGEL